MTEPKENTGRHWARSDLIALGAFGLAAANIAVSVVLWLRGPDIRPMPIDEDIVEFRCADGRLCRSERGRLSVVAPAFFHNAGGMNFPDIVDTIRLTVSYGSETARLGAVEIPNITQSGGGSSEPATPVLIAGQSVGGAEMRFAGYEKSEQKSWLAFADGIDDQSITYIDLVLSAKAFRKGKTISTSCRVVVTDAMRQALAERLENPQASLRMTGICRR